MYDSHPRSPRATHARQSSLFEKILIKAHANFARIFLRTDLVRWSRDEVRTGPRFRDECDRSLSTTRSPRVILTHWGRSSIGRAPQNECVKTDGCVHRAGEPREESPAMWLRLFPCLLSTDTTPPNGPRLNGSFLPLLMIPRRGATSSQSTRPTWAWQTPSPTRDIHRIFLFDRNCSY